MPDPVAWINAWPCWAGEVRVGAHRFYSDSLDRRLYLELHRRGWAGGGELDLLERLVKPGDTVLDVGANVGVYTLALADRVGLGGRIHSFEPVPRLFGCLKRAVDAAGAAQVQLYPVALGDVEGRLPMSARSFNSGDFRIAEGEKAASLHVPVRRVDGLPGIATVDFVKIDVQGYEVPALRGMAGLLRRSPHPAVFFEYWPEGIRRAGYRPEDLIELLSGLGLSPFTPDARGNLRATAWSRLREHCQWRPWGYCGNFVAQSGSSSTGQ